MSKKTIISSITIGLIILGIIAVYYLIETNKPNVVFPNYCPWYYNQVVTFKHHNYKVTKDFISEHEIGSRLCGIMYNGTESIPATQYELYSINHIDSFNKIAIKTKYGYLIADKGKYNKWQ